MEKFLDPSGVEVDVRIARFAISEGFWLFV